MTDSYLKVMPAGQGHARWALTVKIMSPGWTHSKGQGHIHP